VFQCVTSLIVSAYGIQNVVIVNGVPYVIVSYLSQLLLISKDSPTDLYNL